MKNSGHPYFFGVIGLILIAIGGILLKILEPQGVMQALPYVCIGIGCGVFGQGMGNIIGQKAVKKNPHLQQHIEIEQKDERNLAIARRAKAKSYDLMIYVFGALLIAFALMGGDRIAVVLLVCAYLFVVFSGAYYRFRYDKEM